jgi:hypothetical protein
MKTLLLFTSLIIRLSCLAQTNDLPKDESGKIVFTEVVKVDSADANQLFSRAQVAISSLFKSAKDVIQVKDEASKQIVAKGLLEAYGFVKFETTIQCKDGRYKYTITNLEHTNDPRYKYSYAGGALENEKPVCGTFFINKHAWDKIKETTKTQIDDAIVRLKKSMASPAAGNSDKW